MSSRGRGGSARGGSARGGARGGGRGGVRYDINVSKYVITILKITSDFFKENFHFEQNYTQTYLFLFNGLCELM